MKEETKTISVRLPVVEAETLALLAKANNTSISESLRAVIHVGIILAADVTGVDLETIQKMAKEKVGDQQ